MSERACIFFLPLMLTMAVAAWTPPLAEAAQCGAALLLEVGPPAVFDGFDPTAPSRVRFWEAGLAGSNRSDDGCRAGCTAATGESCAGGGSCLALTGIHWLNASCAAPDGLPLRTVFLVEQTGETVILQSGFSVATGGRLEVVIDPSLGP